MQQRYDRQCRPPHQATTAATATVQAVLASDWTVGYAIQHFLQALNSIAARADTARGWTRFAFNKHAALDEHQQDASEAGVATGGSYAINKRDVAELDAALAQSGARAAQLHADHDAAIFGAPAPAEAPKARDALADASGKGRRSGGVEGRRSSERRQSGTEAAQHDRSLCDGRRSRHRSPAEARERRHRSDHRESQRTRRERSHSHDRGGSRRRERSRSHERHGGSGSRRRDRSRSRERPRDTGARRSDRSRSRERERGGSSRRRERSRSHDEHRANRGSARRGANSHDRRRCSRSRNRSRTPTRERARRERDGSRRHWHECSRQSRSRDEERACSARDSMDQALPAKDSSKRLRREGWEDAGTSKRDRKATHEEAGTNAAPRPVPVQVEQTAPAAELRAPAAGSGTAGVRASSGAHGGRSVHPKASNVEKGEHDELSAMAKQMGLTLSELRDIVPEGTVVDQEAIGGAAAPSLQNDFDASAVAQLGESKKGSWRDRIHKRAL